MMGLNMYVQTVLMDTMTINMNVLSVILIYVQTVVLKRFVLSVKKASG